ncbi:hypothetical protein [Burkholderia glumae]|uniref:Uncharacterized protein n=1 Tax=Burkholderia glumae TaxID=337 RepID=A0AAQ0BW11_BURGL|nr:hypothetical protein [Burkholderia glumae]MCM2480771.1 hypothetical protein [Burkholderia glumae]MCM2509090.1 hypothetical protein [Burkholderia glumae]MCM2537555.1 hypothetical protein [Burkholderia glumae]MCM2550330.1 hypothetical protein [Burkholderia glumae]MCQ0030486.1 hypothetical protein [Burkholderia glumae]
MAMHFVLSGYVVLRNSPRLGATDYRFGCRESLRIGISEWRPDLLAAWRVARGGPPSWWTRRLAVPWPGLPEFKTAQYESQNDLCAGAVDSPATGSPSWNLHAPI